MFNAAYSYLESEYYELARNMFQKVTSLDGSNNRSLFLFMYASAFYFSIKIVSLKPIDMLKMATAFDLNDKAIRYRILIL